MAEPVKIRQLKHLDAMLNPLEPDARAILAAQGVEVDPANPPKPYEFVELISRVVYGSDEIVRHPFGALVFGRYDEADAACRNPALGAMGLTGVLASGITAAPLHELFSGIMFSADGPAHRRLRSPVQAWFTPKAVEACRPAIEARARELLEPSLARGQGDLFAEYADPLALSAALIRLGAPADHAAHLGDATIAVFHAFFPMSPEVAKRAERGVATLGAFADELMATRRQKPADDLVSHLLHCVDEGRLTPRDVRAMIVNLLFGGHDLLRGAIVNALFTLMWFRDQWDRLVAEPALARTAAEESFRFAADGAVARMATAPTEVRGRPIAAGTIVLAGGRLRTAIPPTSTTPTPSTSAEPEAAASASARATIIASGRVSLGSPWRSLSRPARPELRGCGSRSASMTSGGTPRIFRLSSRRYRSPPEARERLSAPIERSRARDFGRDALITPREMSRASAR